MVAPGPKKKKKKKSKDSEVTAEELGRKAAKLVKTARPQVRRLVKDASPLVVKASQQAADYVREHEDELKGTALKLIRARLRGPLGMVIDAATKPKDSGPKKA